MKLSEYAETIKRDPEFGPATVHYRYLPPVEAVYGETPSLPSPVLSALGHLGIQNLFKHQVDAMRYIKEGKTFSLLLPRQAARALSITSLSPKRCLRTRPQRLSTFSL